MFAARSNGRVEQNTAADINRARQADIRESLRYHSARLTEIPSRLAELDREWDIERALQANAATVCLAGLMLARFLDRRFLLLPAAVAGFLLQHAVQGWCPPVPLLRRLGFRTAAEICEERCGLRMLGGEYRSFADPAPARFVAEVITLDEAVEA
jgi:hypothetical protein